jgi:hypothetical protein
MVCGNNSGNELNDKDPLKQSVTQKVLSNRSVLFQPPEFIPEEAMGMEIPRRCCACKNCKECKFHMNSLSFKENTDYEIILSKLKLNEERKKRGSGLPIHHFRLKADQQLLPGKRMQDKNGSKIGEDQHVG